MTKEQIFRSIGQIDDHILQRYHNIEMQLVYRRVRKKRKLRLFCHRNRGEF